MDIRLTALDLKIICRNNLCDFELWGLPRSVMYLARLGFNCRISKKHGEKTKVVFSKNKDTIRFYVPSNVTEPLGCFTYISVNYGESKSNLACDIRPTNGEILPDEMFRQLAQNAREYLADRQVQKLKQKRRVSNVVYISEHIATFQSQLKLKNYRQE